MIDYDKSIRRIYTTGHNIWEHDTKQQIYLRILHFLGKHLKHITNNNYAGKNKLGRLKVNHEGI